MGRKPNVSMRSQARLISLVAGLAASLDFAAPVPKTVAEFEVLREPVVLSDATILAIGIRSRDGGQEVTARVSRDEGLSWSSSRDLFPLPRAEGRFGYFRAMVDKDGEVHIFLLCLPPPSGSSTGGRAQERLDIWHAKSRAALSAWNPPHRIWSGRAGDLLSAIQLTSGRILLPISYRTDRSWSNRGPGFDAFTYMGSFASGMLYSDDKGETWRQSPSVLRIPTPALSAIGGVEPVILQLKDGRVWMLIRSQMGRFYESFSSDGAIWAEPEPASIASSESPAGLIRLKDGRILLLVNSCERFPYAYGGRHVLHGAISDNEGRTWHGYREVVRDPLRNQPPPLRGDFGVAYPFPALTQNGKVIFSLGVTSGTRSQHPEESNQASQNEKRAILLLDPAWLDETTQQTDFSHGLDDWSTFGTRGVALVPKPGTAGSGALKISKPDAAWPTGAVWNFPAGQSGKLSLRLRLTPG